MKVHSTDSPTGKSPTLHKTSKIVILVTLSLILLTIIPLHYPLLWNPSFLLKKTPTSSTTPVESVGDANTVDPIRASAFASQKCDLFAGEWVRNPSAPYYSNKTCWAIHEHQNCIKYGRPDSEFMKWRWKPDGCDLPIFNPAQFLDLVRGKSMAFVGDSVGRNQMQSMICLLSRVEYPIDVSTTTDQNFIRWKYMTYNFTMAMFWTPHLVRTGEADPNGPTRTGLFNLYLDEYDEKWTSQIDEFDYVILSGGHWFYRPAVFYENQRIVGCHYCLLDNVPDLNMYYGYKKAFRTAFKAINERKSFKGMIILRTFAPSHFENGIWNQGGDCVRQRPFRSNETSLQGIDMEFYMIQLEEFKAAERKGRERGLRYRLLDTTQAMLLRPDGHPSRFGHWAHENVTLYNDCVHWCLPGPIDTWSDFLLQMLKMEGGRSVHKKGLHFTDRKIKMI